MSSIASVKRKLLGGSIYLSQGFFEGQPTWHYVMVDKMKLPILLKNVKAAAGIDLLDYGRIVLSGFGEKPPEEVATYIKKKYGSVH